MANINDNLNAIGQGQIAPQLQAKRAGAAGANPMQAQAVSLPQPKSGWDWLKQQIAGKPAENLLFPNYYPHQQEAFNQALGMGLQGLQGSNFSFQPIEQQALSNFYEQTIPSIAERFSALGAQGTGAFRRELGSAGAGLQRDLAAMKANYGLNQQDFMLRLLGLGLTPQFESVLSPRQPGMFEKAGENAFKLAGLGAKYFTGGL